MKKLTQISVLLLGLMIVFTGCDSAKKAADEAKDKAKEMAELGDFDMKGLQDKFAGITDGFKDVSADNVDGLTSKITDLTGSLDGMGIGNLKGVAKTTVVEAIKKFGGTIESAMEGISDEGILGKLKPVVKALMDKVKSYQ